VLGRLMENGGERFNFMLFSFISTSSLSITIEECHNWLINYEVFFQCLGVLHVDKSYTNTRYW
jgi:hypothetical protein